MIFLKRNNKTSVFSVMLISVISVLLFSCKSTPPKEKAPAQPAVFSNHAFAVRLQSTLDTGTLKDALQLFAEIPEEKQDDPDLNLLKASLYFSDRQYAEAKQAVAAVALQRPNDSDVIILQAKLAKASGDVNAKNALIKKVIAADPTNTDANLLMADDQMIRKNFPLAKTYFQKALQGEADNLEALLGAGEAAYFQGSFPEARRYFQNALQVDPGLGMAWSYLSKIEEERRAYPKALEYMENAIKCDGELYDYLIDYGLLFQRLGRSKEALTAWTKATKANPRHFLGHAFLAGLQDEMGDADSAYGTYATVVALNPTYIFAWESMGAIAWHRGDWTDAREKFAKAWEINRANSSYPLLMAATYIKEKNPKATKDILQTAMKPLDKNSPQYAVTRLYFDSVEQGIVAKVLNTENKTLRYQLTFYLGLYYEGRGETLLARKYYEQVAAEARPSFFEYRLNNWALETLVRK